MRKNLIILCAICSSVHFISCSSDKKTWNIAKSNNDVFSYKYYIDKFPEGEYRDSAIHFIDVIKNSQPQIPTEFIQPIAKWENNIIDSLTVQISITSVNSKSYKQKKELEYYNSLKEVLGNMGIKVLPQNTKHSTKLHVILNVKALKANYMNWGVMYTGYELKGSISLTGDGKTPYSVPFTEKKPCPSYPTYQKEKIKFFKDPEYIMSQNSKNIEKYIFGFLYNVWGASPFVWEGSYNLPLPPELSTSYNQDLSKYLINNIIRASCSNDASVRKRAMNVVTSKNFKRQIESNVLIESDPTIIEVISNLILKADNKIKRGEWSEDYINTLEILTGKSYDSELDKNKIRRWKRWWFKNKQDILED